MHQILLARDTEMRFDTVGQGCWLTTLIGGSQYGAKGLPTEPEP